MHRANLSQVVFVRDPAERLLSGYLEKCLSKVETQIKNHCLNFKDPSKPPPTFAEFVAGLNRANIRSNGHFAPQVHEICRQQRRRQRCVSTILLSALTMICMHLCAHRQRFVD